jgi:hypothetical protein
MPTLLAVDLGVRTGLALFRSDGRLVWYRSQNFGNAARLRRAVGGLLNECGDLAWVFLEGGGPLADIWLAATAKRAVQTRRVAAEDWRADVLLQRQQRRGPQAKRAADIVARRVIEWSSAARPTSLRHDAAEAILLGVWGAWQVGWLSSLREAIE